MPILAIHSHTPQYTNVLLQKEAQPPSYSSLSTRVQALIFGILHTIASVCLSIATRYFSHAYRFHNGAGIPVLFDLEIFEKEYSVKLELVQKEYEHRETLLHNKISSISSTISSIQALLHEQASLITNHQQTIERLQLHKTTALETRNQLQQQITDMQLQHNLYITAQETAWQKKYAELLEENRILETRTIL